jgi:hypothetical protein
MPGKGITIELVMKIEDFFKERKYCSCSYWKKSEVR